MIKRSITVFLVILLLIGSFIQTQAVNSNAVVEEGPVFLESENLEYFEYILNYSDLLGKGKDITINAINYNSFENAQLSTGEGLKWFGEEGSVTWKFNVPETGVYNFILDYLPLGEGTTSIEFSLLIDDKIPFKEAESLSFPRFWENDGEIRADDLGNEFAPYTKPIDSWSQVAAYDVSGFIKEDFAFALSQGTHEISLELLSQEIEIRNIILKPVNSSITYEQYLKNNSYNDYEGETITIEAEDAIMRSKKTIVPLSDNSSLNVQPQSVNKDSINYIGGNNWNRPGDEITWEFKAPKSGYYSLNFNYRQKATINEKFYRVLKIDNKIPFEEAKSLEFMYSGDWNSYVFADKKGQPYKIFLEEGLHTLSLSVTMGPMAEICYKLNALVYELASFYRSVVMITGENPDANRDYNLFKQIEDYDKKLKSYETVLNEALKELYEITGNDSGSAATNIRNMIDVVERMRKNKYYAHQYKSRFYNNYSALSAWVYERSAMPIDIDAIFITSPENSEDGRKSGFFENIWFSFKKFLFSFVDNYESAINHSEDALELWVNWGRDQAKVLKNLVNSDFVEKYGIPVNIKITNASLLQGILSGNGPDCSLQVSRSEPLNLAMRGGLYDLSKFEDFDQVMKRFMPTADRPYQYNGGTYGLPNTQTFYMLFYRKDIFEEMGLSVPQTWDEFLNTSNLLLRKNMQVGLPYTQITDMFQVNSGVGALNIFPTLLLQKGLSIYSDDLSETTLLEPEIIDTFVEWTDYYNKFGFPKQYDFYNRFRIGLVPMAVVNYSQYATLTAAAPEINRLWQMSPIPGVMQDDGTINRSCAGGGTAAVILRDCENPDLAWEFLKWWTSTDTQYSYASEIETILGTSARHETANVEALKKLSWDKENLDALLEQWSYVQELNEIPGSYYLSRVVDQAFWNTTNGEDPYATMTKWGKIANDEIERKRNQYG